MDKREIAGLIIVFIILVAFPAMVLGYQYIYLPRAYGDLRVIDLVAAVPEAGGFRPEVITVNVGERVRLRISSPDVVHGVAIGKLGIDAGLVYPGELVTVDFVADRPGRYTYYCDSWCSPFPYRMRGTLEVLARGEGADDEDVPAVLRDPGVDIDAPHPAEFFPSQKPSAARGADGWEEVFSRVSPLDSDPARRPSPSDVFQRLRHAGPDVVEAEALSQLSDQEIWDAVAYLWKQTTTPERLDRGKALYEKNCAACHGQFGNADGPGGRYLEERPAQFSDAASMAGGSSLIYGAKIVRGGMGTGMPYWGSIFTAEEIWSLVDYLWTFLFTYDSEENSG